MESGIIHALPTPTDTPFRTPLSSLSRYSQENMSPSTTPPPLPVHDRIPRQRSNESNNAALDPSISPLDPRRFTPTLHANLVSEILSLRRDLETRTKDIEHLEQSLHTSQVENESLSQNLTASHREVRSVKKQMQLLESGTLSAITDLSHERDTALEESADLRKRLDQSQKKAKSSGESALRTQQLWEKEREAWTSEKRALETKVHVVEGRLKVVLNEVASAQLSSSTTEEKRHYRSGSRSSVAGSPIKHSGHGLLDRRQSGASLASDNAGGRASSLSFANEASINLADELALEGIDEGSIDEAELDYGRISPDALPEERGRPTSSLSIKARKVLGMPFDAEIIEYGERSQSIVEAFPQDHLTRSPTKKTVYVDSAVQNSRPTTPTQLGEDKLPAVDTAGKSVATMVSVSCQTIDFMSSPPATPRQHESFLATIPESLWEKVETKSVAVQTDDSSKRHQYKSSWTDTDDLMIPTIAISAPKSRPVTPQNAVKLPPHTKNVSCQVKTDALLGYTSTWMQTEEIRVDRRNLLISQLMQDTAVYEPSRASSLRSRTTAHSRKTSQPVSNSAMKRSAPPIPVVAPMISLTTDSKSQPAETLQHPSIDNGSSGSSGRPTRPVSDADDDIFQDDDVFNRPTAKLVVRNGKVVMHEPSLEDIGHWTARSAGENVALENLRLSEDALPAEYRGQADSMARTKGLKRTSTIRRGQSSTARSNSSSMRRSAMISSGTAVHNHQHRHSLSTNASSEGSGAAPPIPIPLRYSSARLGKSFSEGGRSSRASSNASPTRQARRVAKPVLRKARSGPALSPAAPTRRQRSKSPPWNSRVSIVPEMPVFNMPEESHITRFADYQNASPDAVAPRPSIATGPSRQAQHNKTNSNAPLVQQNSVVDAIAQTMVGEWMYKYVRRRKSFGKPEKDWDPNKSADELVNNPGSAGVRHKRWVWVAPYERAIMWSSKQPMNGAALLGKTGRKLTIKSVLDVKDENPMPKNSLTGLSFNRSILILTPQRALKFTATSQERHYIWLTALSFLSHSPLSVGDLAALPPPPEEETPNEELSPPLMGSFPRRRIRDSIRLAKASSRQPIDGQTFSPETNIGSEDHHGQRPATSDTVDTTRDAALPPIIRRYHNRKRSNTVPKNPPSAFRSFISFRETGSSATSSNNSQSRATTEHGSSDQGPHTPSLGQPSMPSTRRGSEASTSGRPNPMAFFDFGSNSSHNASMTMRMDAFIDNKQAGRGGYKHTRLSQGLKPLEKRKDISYWDFDDSGMPSLSPIDAVTPVDATMRYGENTGRDSMERDHFRGF